MKKVLQALLIIVLLVGLMIAGEKSLLVIYRDYFIFGLLGVSFLLVISFVFIGRRATTNESDEGEKN